MMTDDARASSYARGIGKTLASLWIVLSLSLTALLNGLPESVRKDLHQISSNVQFAVDMTAYTSTTGSDDDADDSQRIREISEETVQQQEQANYGRASSKTTNDGGADEGNLTKVNDTKLKSNKRMNDKEKLKKTGKDTKNKAKSGGTSEATVFQEEEDSGNSNNQAIFFNIFVNPDSRQKIMTYLREQMYQVRNAIRWENLTIYYNQIGVVEEDVPCLGKCRLLNKYEEGWEELTLTSVHDYCVRNPDHTVTYLHNKGSYNSALHNHRNRRLVTRTLPKCQNMTKYNCNVCGAYFQHNPHFHFSTNMWTASCEYIRHLLPPRDYQQQRIKLCEYFLKEFNEQKCNTTAATDRHVMELWIVSHPMLRPCTTMTDPFFKFTTGWEDFKPVLYPGPYMRSKPHENVFKTIILHLRQFHYLYGTAKPKDGFCDNMLTHLMDKPCDRLDVHLKDVKTIATTHGRR